MQHLFGLKRKEQACTAIADLKVVRVIACFRPWPNPTQSFLSLQQLIKVWMRWMRQQECFRAVEHRSDQSEAVSGPGYGILYGKIAMPPIRHTVGVCVWTLWLRSRYDETYVGATCLRTLAGTGVQVWTRTACTRAFCVLLSRLRRLLPDRFSPDRFAYRSASTRRILHS